MTNEIFCASEFFNEADNTWVQFNTDLFGSGAKYLYKKFRQKAIIIKMNN